MNIWRNIIANIKFYVKKIRKDKNKDLYNEIDISKDEKLKLSILFRMHTGKYLF